MLDDHIGLLYNSYKETEKVSLKCELLDKGVVNMGLFTAEDVATYLGVPRSAAYAILHRADCPTVAWGKRLYIRKDDLDKWVLQHRRDIASAGEGESYAR